MSNHLQRVEKELEELEDKIIKLSFSLEEGFYVDTCLNKQIFSDSLNN